MEKHTFSIPNISCGHCVITIKKELSELEGVKSVEGNPENKIIRVEWEEPTSLKDIEQKLKDVRYPVSS